MSKTTIPRGGITADAIDATLIADDAISEEHLDATAITGHTALAEAPADTDEFLISDGGTLKRLDASYVGGGAYTLLSSNDLSSGVSEFIDNDFFTTYSSYKHFLLDCQFVVPDDGNNDMIFVFQDGSGDVAGNIRAAANQIEVIILMKMVPMVEIKRLIQVELIYLKVQEEVTIKV
jgi:hypothetical protein